MAVLVCRPENFGAEVQHPCAITGPDKQRVINKAIRVRDTMENGHRNGPYSIYVGELTEEVIQPLDYTLRKL